MGLKIVNANKLAREGAEAGRYREQVALNEAMQRTEEYYWQIVAQKENLLTLDAVEAQLGEINRKVALSVEAGTSSLTDLLDAETLYRQSQDQFTAACAAYRTHLSKYLIVTGR